MEPEQNSQGNIRISDEIRNYCRDKYIKPAREAKLLVVAIKSGDVHESLKYKNRLPAVCATLGSNLFENDNRLKRLAVDGPLNGMSTIFVYKLM